MSFITSYCHISNDACTVNGKIFLSGNNEDNVDWIKQLYKKLELDYPKFYKMDTLSKIAFIGSELIKNQNQIFNLSKISQETAPLSSGEGQGGEVYGDDEIALIFSNRNSSADTDIKFKASYTKELLPSPALFVYTLPNILIGEIAIRNQWYGENLFFIAPEFNADFFQSYAEIVLSKNSKACLCGWMDVLENSIDGFLFTVEKTATSNLNLPFTSKILSNLYKGKN